MVSKGASHVPTEASPAPPAKQDIFPLPVTLNALTATSPTALNVQQQLFAQSVLQNSVLAPVVNHVFPVVLQTAKPAMQWTNARHAIVVLPKTMVSVLVVRLTNVLNVIQTISVQHVFNSTTQLPTVHVSNA